PFPEKAPWLSLDGSTPFVAALRSGRQQWVCPATRATGVFRTPTSFPEVKTKWVSFGLAAQKAAIAAGFDRKIAAHFVGAMGEMVSNIYEHSGAHGSGIVAFKASSGAFEFVVMDRGIGVLQSLRSCVDYEHVTDHGMALQLALKDGISRFGPTANRGHGF